MAKRESCRIDSRNQASYEMCRMLAPMLEYTDLPLFDDMEFKYGRKADSSAEKPEFDFHCCMLGMSIS